MFSKPLLFLVSLVLFQAFSSGFLQEVPIPKRVLDVATFIENAFVRQKVKFERIRMGNSLWLGAKVTGGTKRAKAVVDEALKKYASNEWGKSPLPPGVGWSRNFELPTGEGFGVFLSAPDAEGKVAIQFALGF